MKTKKQINESLKFYQAKGSGNGNLYTCEIDGLGFVNDNDNNVWLFKEWESVGRHNRNAPVKIRIIGKAETKPELITLIQMACRLLIVDGKPIFEPIQEEPDYGYTPSTINTSIYNDF